MPSKAVLNLPPLLKNPFKEQLVSKTSPGSAPNIQHAQDRGEALSPYEIAIEKAKSIKTKAYDCAQPHAVRKQHAKGRMTVWERFESLTTERPHVLFENFGAELDGASIATAVLTLEGRKVAAYGHDFTRRAGAMDATNGRKLARLFEFAGQHRLPVVGLNDSAGAYVPAGVGGLDGYAQAFSALRKISGVVPSIMCMFGFNAGGGSYLPRQGSFVIQPRKSFFGLTGVEVVRSVLGEDVSPDQLGGPQVHTRSGVADYMAKDERHALALVRKILSWIPDHNAALAPSRQSDDPLDRPCKDFARVLARTINGPGGYSTPMPIVHLVADVVDDGVYFPFEPERAQNTVCAFGRVAGFVVGFVANNSAVCSGQLDYHAALKNARFIRFCNLYNIPLIFIEDTTGFLPGQQQETQGIVQAGRAMLDAIIDVRTPRMLVVVRNAFGGAYASYNNYETGADWVIGLPTARIAVMGPVGRRFVYKKEISELDKLTRQREDELFRDYQAKGLSPEASKNKARHDAQQWFSAQDQQLVARYETQLMNPQEALALGSLSEIVMPEDLRAKISHQLQIMMQHYQPQPFEGTQREFH